MDAIQRLRAKAQANKKLAPTKEQHVTVEQVQGKQVIAIAPTQADTVYVPYYDPSVVYGDWPYADYPPYYFPVPPYLRGFIATGIAFGAGYALGRWGGYWNGGFNWNNNNITINRPGAGAGNRWQPNVAHHGRGNLGQGLGGRGNLGQHHRPSNRPAAGTKPSRGHHAAHRAGGRGGQHAGRGGRGGHHVTHRGAGRGGGAMRAGGMRGGGGRRGGGRGRRSDIMLKHDIVFLGRLDDGLGFYRFSYNGTAKAYVGVIAQEVQQVMPQAVARGRDGYLTVNYERLGLKFESYDQWIRAGARIPATVKMQQ